MPLKSVLDHGCIVEMTCKFKLESPGVLRPATPGGPWRQKAYTRQPARLACISDASGFRDPWNRAIRNPPCSPLPNTDFLSAACGSLCGPCVSVSCPSFIGRAFSVCCLPC